MQHDQIIWEVINNQFCSFKAKIAKEKTVSDEKFAIHPHHQRIAFGKGS